MVLSCALEHHIWGKIYYYPNNVQYMSYKLKNKQKIVIFDVNMLLDNTRNTWFSLKKTVCETFTCTQHVMTAQLYNMTRHFLLKCMYQAKKVGSHICVGVSHMSLFLRMFGCNCSEIIIFYFPSSNFPA